MYLLDPGNCRTWVMDKIWHMVQQHPQVGWTTPIGFVSVLWGTLDKPSAGYLFRVGPIGFEVMETLRLSQYYLLWSYLCIFVRYSYSYMCNYSPAFILFHGHLLTLRISPAMFGCVVGFGPSPRMTTPWFNEMRWRMAGSEGCKNEAKSNMPTFKISSQHAQNGVFCCGTPWVINSLTLFRQFCCFPWVISCHLLQPRCGPEITGFGRGHQLLHQLLLGLCT